MKHILCLGDLHIKQSNLDSISLYFVQLEKYLSTLKIDMIIIMGDTLDSHEVIYTQCFNKMLEYIKLCEKYAPTYTLVGNHEYINNQQFLTKNHPFNHLKNIVDDVILIDDIVLCPYVPDGRLIEALNIRLVDKWKTVKCIFGHQLLDGVYMGPILADKVEKWEETYPFLISGHIHQKQRPQQNLYYTGSSLQVSFDEKPDKTIALIIIDDTVSIEEINIFPPQKTTINVDIKDIDELKIQTQENLKVKVCIAGDEEEFKTFKKTTKYKNLLEKDVKVVFKNVKKVSINKPHTTFKTFNEILYDNIKDKPEMLVILNSLNV